MPAHAYRYRLAERPPLTNLDHHVTHEPLSQRLTPSILTAQCADALHSAAISME